MNRIACLLFCAVIVCEAQYSIPKVKIEAFSPKGVRVSIPDVPGVQLFAFHARINENIVPGDQGTLQNEVLAADKGFWAFYEPEQVLKVGDKINYWVFVQFNRLGFRRDDQTFKVEALLTEVPPLSCETSLTTINNGQETCKETLIFEDFFTQLNTNKWIVEQYIPATGPNFEFNSYEYNAETVSIKDNKLVLKPIPKTSMAELRGILDLRNSCTSPRNDDCFMQQRAGLLLPPVRSGKLRSKFSFKYGKIEVRAKLPEGDWIFPEISLISSDESKRQVKIWIAYSRGNAVLVGNAGDDLGGKLLFAGPLLSSSEPVRSKELKSIKNDQPYYSGVHTFSLLWQPGMMVTYVDNVEFGRVYNSHGFGKWAGRDAPFNSEFYISLGVGVGGNNDFPDDYWSGSYRKPWTNKDSKQIKHFFDERSKWLPSWRGENCSLQVEYVKVYSI